MEIGMNAIVTVIGKDKVGIIAAVCIKLAEMNVNVLDISQTILDGKFTMVMAVKRDPLYHRHDRPAALGHPHHHHGYFPPELLRSRCEEGLR